MLPDPLQRTLADVAANSQNGATWLVAEVARTLGRAFQDVESLRTPASLQEVALAIGRARPDMAPFWNLANALALLAEDSDKHLPLEHLETTCTFYDAGAALRLDKLSTKACTSLSPAERLLTHSLSHSIENALCRMHEEGLLRQVICTDGAPMHEGRTLASSLSVAGIPVKLVTDAGAYVELPLVDMVLVGGDGLTCAALWNKTGTFGLAAAAAHSDIPVYALLDTTKMLPEGLESLMGQVAHDPNEVWNGSPKGVDVQNYYFDCTPLNLFRGFVTEEGVLRPDEVRERLAALRVARLWSDRGLLSTD